MARMIRKAFTTVGKFNQEGHPDHGKYHSMMVVGEGTTQEEIVANAIKTYKGFFVCNLDVLMLFKGSNPVVHWGVPE